MASDEVKAKPVLGKLGRLLIIILVQLVVIVLLLEIGLRLAQPFSDGLRAFLYLPTVQTEYDGIRDTRELLQKSYWGFQPGAEWGGFSRNSKGFRTPEYEYARRTGVLRVVVLGDSFASDSGGVPWRHIWPTLLGQELRKSLDQEVEVINLGVPAVGPRYLLRLWELEGQRLNPNVVVLSFFVGNDFTDEFHEPLRAADPGVFARFSLVFRLVRNGKRLWQERKLLQQPRVQKELAGSGIIGAELGEQVESPAPTFSGVSYFQIENARSKICETKSDYFEKRFAAVAPILKRLNASVLLNGAKLAVMIIPDEFQVNQELLATLTSHSGKIDLDLPQRRLAELLKQENIAYLDLLPLMQRIGQEQALYRERDTHWNSAGNLVAAESLARFMVEARLVPKVSW